MPIIIKRCAFNWQHKKVKIIFTIFLLLSFFLYIYKYMPSNVFKTKFSEDWEESLPADFDTCRKIIPVLMEVNPDEGTISSNSFSWPTPMITELLLKYKNRHDTDAERALIDILCGELNDSYKSINIVTEDMLKSPNDPSLTSAEHTTFEVLNKDYIEVGDEIHLKIQTRDSLGGMTSQGGGDFFKIRAENCENKASVAAKSIEYLGNGTYSAKIKTFWVGRHDIKVFLGQSGHFVDLVKHFTSKMFGLESWYIGEFGKSKCGKKKRKCFIASSLQRTYCFITLSPTYSKSSICDYSGAKGEEWFCVKPRVPLTCDDLLAVYSKRRQNSIKLFQYFPLYDRGTLNRLSLQGKDLSISVLPKKHLIPNENVDQCTSGLITPSPSGFWLNGIWKSKVCNNFHFSQVENAMKNCLSNRVFYFIGDSTARQWFEYFVYPPSLTLTNFPFNAREITTFIDVWEPRTAVINKLNTTFYYRSHGQLLQNGGLFYATRFISVQLDEIPVLTDKGAHLTIVLCVGPHFYLYNPDVYLNRMISTRDAALRLLSRNPKTTIIVKGTNTFVRGIGIGECCPSDWISFRQHRLAKTLFDGTDVIYLDVWDMTVSHWSEDLVHPVREVITNEIDMALSFTCLREKKLK